MSNRTIVITAIILLATSSVFAKLSEGAPVIGLALMFMIAVAIGIVYGAFVMKARYSKQIKEALENLQK